jgi:hypothetical protein
MEDRRRRSLGILFLLILVAVACPASDGTVEANRVRQTTLDTLLSARRAVLKSKTTTLSQLDAQLREAMTATTQVVADGDGTSPERVAEMLKRTLRLQNLLAQRVLLLQSMQDAATEIAALQTELDRVKSSLDRSRQVMEGHWSITYMPAGTRGDLYISQNGTILTGDYRLENGQSGSLQGLFVKDQIVLERIDATFGKMGRLEGAVSKDRLSVKGTWYSYDLSSGQPVTGPFTLDKVQEDQSP